MNCNVQIKQRIFTECLKNNIQKNSDIHTYNTRSKDMFRISSGSQSFSNISARVWKFVGVNSDINVTLVKFEHSLRNIY